MARTGRTLQWLPAALLGWTQVGYGLGLAAAARLRSDARPDGPHPATARARGNDAEGSGSRTPRVSLVIAAYREEEVIAAKVANARALHWPDEALQIIVAVDGGADPDADRTADRAEAAGAHLVLRLPRGGKVRAQDAAVAAADGELLAFSDANALWDADALAHLVEAFSDPAVGYACGQVRFVNEAGTNQEGLYWRYEMWIRAHESALASVTAGNGAIYAVRPSAYLHVDPIMGHDLSLPFNMVKRGWRAVYAPDAKATEKMVPSVEGEWRRKRRMMSHAWPIVIRGGMLDPRGYGPAYGTMILSHRLLRYASPLLHVQAFVVALLAARRSRAHLASLVAQVALLVAAAAGGRVRARPLLVARYYVLTTTSLALGLWDWARHGTPAGWDAPEGTR